MDRKSIAEYLPHKAMITSLSVIGGIIAGGAVYAHLSSTAGQNSTLDIYWEGSAVRWFAAVLAILSSVVANSMRNMATRATDKRSWGMLVMLMLAVSFIEIASQTHVIVMGIAACFAAVTMVRLYRALWDMPRNRQVLMVALLMMIGGSLMGMTSVLMPVFEPLKMMGAVVLFLLLLDQEKATNSQMRRVNGRLMPDRIKALIDNKVIWVDPVLA
ncbi:MAG: hypothetical protein Q8R76_11250 [Candidatus Omnitrophota bacterium]|nr:hypothetical protein [Candidatus Omnitrophota bacterium]